MNIPILHTQTELVSLVNARLRNTASRWPDSEVYSSLNLALNDWHKRVLIPYIYTIPGGFVDATYHYDLPDYIDGPLTPQTTYYAGEWPFAVQLSAEATTWRDVVAFDVEPNTTGGQTLRLHHYPYSMDGRILWWGHNGPVPETLPVLSASITDSSTSLTLTTKPVVGRSGYVRIDTEWMQYAGTTEGSTTLTLTNLVRGLNGTSAAAHSGAATVTWGVAMDRAQLLNQLMDGTRGYLMEHNLMNGATQEADHYEKQMLFYRARADQFWRQYAPVRAPKFRLSRMTMGV